MSTIESLKSFFDVGAVILLFLTFAFGAGVLITGNILNKRQATQLRQFDKDLTAAKTELGKQQERAAEADERASKIESRNLQLRRDLENAKVESRDAESKLAEQQRKTAEAQQKEAEAQMALRQSVKMFARRAGDRALDIAKFVDGLKKRPKRNIELWRVPDDVEAERFSGDIERALQSQDWPVSARTLTADDHVGRIGPLLPMAKTHGLTLFSSDWNDFEGTNGFASAILEAIELFGGQSSEYEVPETALPKGTILVVIGTKDKI